MTALHLDWESKSEIDLPKRGLDVYSAHPSTKILMGGYAFDDGAPKLWVAEDGPPPRELIEALEDPHVEKWAFNAAFERVMAKRCLGVKTPYKGWRCTQVLGHMQSFVGRLGDMGVQVGLPVEQQKMAEGKRLIKIFCMPQRVTKNQPLRWRDSRTDPEDWELFCQYCPQDVVTERAIKNRLIKFPVPPEEWELYELDQKINDRGLPVDMGFVHNAITMSARRKAELTSELTELTGLRNPNSVQQLLGWLRERGYPFEDLQKNTVKKVLAENAEHAKQKISLIVEPTDDGEADVIIESDDLDGGFIPGEAVRALRLRQQAARTAHRKYDALVNRVGSGDRLRYGFQFAGAARTSRWAGRGFQAHNLTRTPDELEMSKASVAAGAPYDFLLVEATEAIRRGDYEALTWLIKEPMNALAGLVRSAIRAPDGKELLAADLASIETCVIAWLSGCERLLNVFRDGRDAYKDFGTTFYNVKYEDVTKIQRTNSKPAVLGCGFRLGGGELIEGKKTGLWGYAENMGIALSRVESHKSVRLFREAYPEIPQLWYALERSIFSVIRTGIKSQPLIRMPDGRKILVPVVVEMFKPYLTIKLPSGRRIYYYKPQIHMKTMRGKPTVEYPDGEPYTKPNFTYMGKQQNGNKWVRVWSHGGKTTENIVQAVARDVLTVGMNRADDAGFPLIGHVHDELINEVRKGSNEFTVDRLIELMTEEIPWCATMPLGAAGWQAQFYRKD